jgi:hypothetical protein
MARRGRASARRPLFGQGYLRRILAAKRLQKARSVATDAPACEVYADTEEINR